VLYVLELLESKYLDRG